MKYLVLVLALGAITLSAQQNKLKKKPKIKLASTKDPVCNMDMPLHLKDTVHYKGKIYGVCSDHCKNEIKRAPRKYIK
jgi:YHS domain-containing protein